MLFPFQSLLPQKIFPAPLPCRDPVRTLVFAELPLVSSFRFEYCPAFITKHQRVVSKLILPAHPLKRIAQTTDHESSGDLRCSFGRRDPESSFHADTALDHRSCSFSDDGVIRFSQPFRDCDGLRGSSYLQSRDGRQSWRLQPI